MVAIDGTPLSTPHNMVLITECHNSHKHSQSPLTKLLQVLELIYIYKTIEVENISMHYTNIIVVAKK